MKRAGVVIGVALAILFASAPPNAVGSSAVIGEFRVIASPFTSNSVSTRHKAGIRLTLLQPARLTLAVETSGGALVRKIATNSALGVGAFKWGWAGRRDNGTFAPNGDYRVHLKVTGDFGSQEQWLPVRKGMPPIYPANPAAITVLINPGHGGVGYSGAVWKTVREADLNLDIGLRLRRLLRAAGINVVMTRETDVHIPNPEFDVNGDGFIGPPTAQDEDWDGLSYRLDIGNLARADVHIFNHNNGSGTKSLRYTETFTGMERSWTPEGIELATAVQGWQITQLDTFRSATYYPIDHGVRDGARYYTLSPYDMVDQPLEPRPALQPTILTESLFVSNAIERELLLKGQVREAIAIAMYMGLRDYFAARDYGIRYELVSGPATAAAGGPADYQVKVTNTGNLTSAGWQLQLHSVVAVPFYDGSEAIGELMGAVTIPDGLAPGQSTTLSVHATAPPTAGAWLVKADVWTTEVDRPYLSQRGVVSLQVPLTTTEP
jgi:N-acetylmuramoyl-L-alanine amidase